MKTLPANHPLRKRIKIQEKKAQLRYKDIEKRKSERAKVATRLKRDKATTKE